MFSPTDLRTGIDYEAIVTHSCLWHNYPDHSNHSKPESIADVEEQNVSENVFKIFYKHIKLLF